MLYAEDLLLLSLQGHADPHCPESKGSANPTSYFCSRLGVSPPIGVFYESTAPTATVGRAPLRDAIQKISQPVFGTALMRTNPNLGRKSKRERERERQR